MINVDVVYNFLSKLYCLPQVSLLNGFALPPLHAFIDVTYRCNLRCDMCHSLSLIEKSDNISRCRNELTPKEIENNIRKLSRKTLVTFTGGEPFCRKDMGDILSSACKDYRCHVITNGTLINNEIAESLVELRALSIMSKGLLMIGFSIAGPEETHDDIVKSKGAFKRTLEAVKLIQEIKKQKGAVYPLLHSTTVITSGNASFLSDVYSIAKELGMDYCNFTLENSSQFSRDQDYNQYEALYRPPTPVSKINRGLLNSQLYLLEDSAYAGKNPKIRFSPYKINREEIIKYYSEGLNYKDYRCYVPWSKIGFSAFGDIICCPYLMVGHAMESINGILWNSIFYRQFREKLIKEKSFPCCSGCCYSEYTGG